uniref:HPP transmembrane region domain-containing protein n=1 Tax=Phaeocystis antarctica TaxID=33657 RepID=A0A7S0EW41_9EUKA
MAPLAESALAGIGAALGFLALYATSQVLPMLPGDVKVMCPPLGAVAVLLFCLPKAPASSTYAVIIGHLVGGAVAVGVNQVLAKGDPMAPGVAVALAIFGMKLFDCVHPPAAAYAFFAAVQGFDHPKYVLFPGLLGAVVLVVVQKVYLSLTATAKLELKKS